MNSLKASHLSTAQSYFSKVIESLSDDSIKQKNIDLLNALSYLRMGEVSSMKKESHDVSLGYWETAKEILEAYIYDTQDIDFVNPYCLVKSYISQDTVNSKDCIEAIKQSSEKNT